MPLVTKDNLDEFYDWIADKGEIAVDTETTGLNPWNGDRLCGISIGAEGKNFYLPFRHAQGTNLGLDVLSGVIDLLQERTLIFWNAQFDVHILMQDGFKVPITRIGDAPPIIDAMLGAHLVNENEPNFQLKSTADRYNIGRGSADEVELKEYIEKVWRKELAELRKTAPKDKSEGDYKGIIWRLKPEQVTDYAEADTELTWGVMAEVVMPGIDYWGLSDLYSQVSNYDLLITRITAHGLGVDHAMLERLIFELEEELETRSLILYEESYGNISDPNKHAQVRNYLGITSSAYEFLLPMMESDHPQKDLIKLIVEARGTQKVLGSYLWPYRRYVGYDGKIHPRVKVAGTATGRSSCKDPNVQALPRDVKKQPAKMVFVPTQGHMVLGEVDLSQAELRIASHFAAKFIQERGGPGEILSPTSDGVLLAPMGIILESGRDLHQETANKMGIPDDRTMAKRINLSAVFGIGWKEFAKTYFIPERLAAQRLGEWHRTFPEFRWLLYHMQEVGEQRGFIQLESGRVRRFDEAKGAYTRKASSNLVQGTVADVMRHAMHRVDEYLRMVGGNLLLQVHDSLLFEFPDGLQDQIMPEVIRLMTDFEFRPFLTADGKVGRSWGEMEEWKDASAHRSPHSGEDKLVGSHLSGVQG